MLQIKAKEESAKIVAKILMKLRRNMSSQLIPFRGWRFKSLIS